MKQDKPIVKELLTEALKAAVIAIVLGAGALIYGTYQKSNDQNLEYQALKGELIMRIGMIKFFASNPGLNKKNLIDDINNSNYVPYGAIGKYGRIPLRSLGYKVVTLSKNVANDHKILKDIITLEIIIKTLAEESRSSVDASMKDINKILSDIESGLPIMEAWVYGGYKWGPILE